MQPLQSLASGSRGVGRYVFEVTKRLLANEAAELTLAFNKRLGETDSRHIFETYGFAPDTFRKLTWDPPDLETSGAARNFNAKRSAELIREFVFLKDSPDVIWNPNLQEGWSDNAATSVGLLTSKPVVVSTLHDLTPLEYPEFCLTEINEHWYFEKLAYVSASDFVITDSEYSNHLIHQHLQIPLARTVVVPLGVEPGEWRSTDLRSISRVPGPYFIYFGGAEPYKNIEILLPALAEFNRSASTKHHLVFAGSGPSRRRSTLESIAISNQIENFIHFEPETEQSHIAHLLRNAIAFVYPSLAEGFGLPALEAVASGCPVLVSNTGAISRHGVLSEGKFSPTNASDISRRMAWITQEESRRRLLLAQTEYISHLSWDLSASMIFDSLLRLAEDKRPVNSNLELDFRGEISRLSLSSSEIKEVARSVIASGIGPSRDTSLFYDVSALVKHDSRTGIQRVAKEAFKGLELLHGRALVPVWFDVHKKVLRIAEPRYTKDGDIGFHPIRDIVHLETGDQYLCLDLNPNSTIAMKPLLRELKNIGVTVSFLVYDILPVVNPDWFEEDLRRLFAEYFRTLIELACRIIVNSNHVKKQIIDNSEIQDNLIDVIPLANSHLVAKASRLPYFEAGSKIRALMVGTIEPRKGHAEILQLFLEHPLNDVYHLTVVGRAGWLANELVDLLEEFADSDQISYLGGVSDAELSSLFQESDVLIAASLDEGFGLPLLEAGGNGLSVIARDIPVFREVAPPGTEFIDFSDQVSAAQKLRSYADSFFSKLANPSREKPVIRTWLDFSKELTASAYGGNLES